MNPAAQIGQSQSRDRRNLRRAQSGEDLDLKVIENADSSSDPVRLAVALIPNLVRLSLNCEYKEGEQLGERVGELLGGKLDRVPFEFHWSYLNARGVCAAHMIDYEASDSYLLRACALAKAADQQAFECASLIHMSRNHHRQGRTAESIEILTRVTFNEDLPPASLLYTRVNLAEMFSFQEQWDQALRQLKTVAQADSGLNYGDMCFFHSALGRTLTNLGEPDDAEQSLVSARRMAMNSGWRGNAAIVDFSVAELRLAQGRLCEARQLAKRSVASFAKRNATYEEMEAKLTLARIDVAGNDPTGALVVLDDRRAAQMGAPFLYHREKLRAQACEQLGDWEQVVVHRSAVAAHNVEARQNLSSLYAMLMTNQQGPTVRDQRRLLSIAKYEVDATYRERSELLDIVGHDLRSPLTATRLTLEVMKQQVPSKSRDERLDTAQQTLARIQTLVGQLSTLSQWEEGGLKFDLTECRLGEIVMDVAREFESWATHKAITIGVDLLSGDQIFVLADETRVRQIMQNLISNALKYSNAESAITLTVSSTNLVALSPASYHPETVAAPAATVSVVDQGLGLSGEDLRHLFGKYTRLSAKPTGNEASSGNGLYIARSFARSMAGDIACHSAGKGQGSTFVLQLPLSSPAQTSLS